MIKQSPLVDLYRAKGATLVEQGHWLLPAHFGDPVAEYHAIRTRVGLFDLCQRSLLRFTGDGRTSFLNDRVSNDVTALSSGEGLHAAFLDLHGKILADARVFCAAGSLLVDVPDRCKEPLLHHLKRYLVADKVEIQDQSADYLMLSEASKPCGRALRSTTARATSAALPVAAFHRIPIRPSLSVIYDGTILPREHASRFEKAENHSRRSFLSCLFTNQPLRTVTLEAEIQ